MDGTNKANTVLVKVNSLFVGYFHRVRKENP